MLYGAPFDGTTSYRPGTRFGSRMPCAPSPTGWRATAPIRTRILTDCSVFDSGDLELPYRQRCNAPLTMIEERAADRF